MHYQFPPEIEELVQAKMASGEYQNEDELLLNALQALGEINLRHEELRREIQARLPSAGQGQSSPLDSRAFKAEAHKRLTDPR